MKNTQAEQLDLFKPKKKRLAFYSKTKRATRNTNDLI